MDLGAVLRDGYLYKRRENKSWRKQWVVLRSNYLSFAKGPKVRRTRLQLAPASARASGSSYH